jgi:hypothetical protein
MKKLIIAAMLMTSGCATSTRVNKLDATGESRIAGVVMADVGLSAETLTREEPLRIWIFGKAKKQLYATGEKWREVFVGEQNAPAKISVSQSELSDDVTGMGWTSTSQYRATATLEYRGQKIEIQAYGKRSAAMKIESARRQAVELCVVDMASKVREAMRQIDSSTLADSITSAQTSGATR